jgi:5-oxoprolinase (ATP-hydrolysing)
VEETAFFPARQVESDGFTKIVTFDMGGTSTDVAYFEGQYERAQETEIAGARIRSPMLSIHTVAAGGGSIVQFDGQRFRVGPESAGADPGPACYRRGGPLTITDCNVLLGKISAEKFPAVFGPNGDQTIDVQVVRKKFEELSRTVSDTTGQSWTAEKIAEGFIDIAVQKMANAIRHVTTEKGRDTYDAVLQCFGGAGGQHACKMADLLGIRTIFVHRLAGVLSAYGIGLADVTVIKHLSVEAELTPDLLATLKNPIKKLDEEARAAVEAQSPGTISSKISGHLRYAGTDFSSPCEFGDAQQMMRCFHAEQRTRFGFEQAEKPIVLESISVEAISSTSSEMLRDAMTAETTTIVIEDGWHLKTSNYGHAVLTRGYAGQTRRHISTAEADPVLLEVFNNMFMFIAEQMGVTLQKTSHSVNIKERLDFSCALFDHEGNLIANAPHIPVHLGSMGESVKELISRVGDSLKAGDVYALNDPYHGGTHLPDITVMAPFFDSHNRLSFFVAARGHHADIGGITPGSMPPASKSIDEEGVLLDMVKVVDNHKFLDDEVARIFAAGTHPARNIRQNIADLKAQVAAVFHGCNQLQGPINEYGAEVVHAYAQFVQDNAEYAVRKALRRLRSGTFESTMDNGAKIVVKIDVDAENETAVVDFSGTSLQTNDNFNAPFAVCKAAVLYVFRTLIDDEIPLNAGCLRPIKLIVPEGCLLNPKYPAAVVAGNVETSQVVVDTLYGALGVLASSQGTMNNFTFGNDQHQYYETICGGMGAGASFDGASAVQSHMTNSRLTDPEVIEHRFPVLVEEFAIRENSGGAGQHRGGDGVVRRIRFLTEMTASILSNRRTTSGFGIEGGTAGERGKNYVIRNNGAIDELSSRDSVTMKPGDAFVVESPGGGGFGVA